MNAKQLLTFGVTLFLASFGATTVGEAMAQQHIQIAEIEVDPAHRESYKAAVQEQIEAAIRLEPGSSPLHGIRDLPRHGRLPRASPGAPFPEIQGHGREDGQIPQACAGCPHYAGRESEVMTIYQTHRLLFSLLCVAFLPFHARADEVQRGLVTIGMQRLFDDVRPDFEATYGQKLSVEFASTLDIAKRVQVGEITDFVITSRAGVDSLIKTGLVAAGQHFGFVGSSIAVAVPSGHPKPDISTVEALKRALLAARTVSFTDPASGGPSGIHLEKVLKQFGIAEQIRAKTKFPPAGGAVGDILARAEADIGIQQMAELSSFNGVDVVGSLPTEIQSVTEYAIAIPANAIHPGAGKALVEFMRSPRGVAAIKARGLEPR